MILYIDTSADYCEVALLNGQKIVAHLRNEERLKHSQVLHNQIEELRDEFGLDFDKLKAVAVMNGPGSYTGLRVGLAAAKSFCYASNAKLILLNKLECMSKNAWQLHEDTPVISLLPARANEYFINIYHPKEGVNICKTIEIEDFKLFSDYSLYTLTNVNLPDTIQTKRLTLELNFLSDLIGEIYEIQAFSDIFNSEPFYLKLVHANKPKPKF